MKKTLIRLFTFIMLMIFSMGVDAKIKVDLGGEKNDGVYPGGTIVEKNQTEPNANGLITVTITVTPHKGFTIKQTDIVVVSTYSPEGSGTRSPRIAGNLTLLGTDPKDPSEPRDYTFVVGSSLGAWIKEANFHDDGAKGGGNRSTGTRITSLSEISEDGTGDYIIIDDIEVPSTFESIASFSGTLEASIDPDTHMPYRIKNLGAPLFTTLTGTVKNIVLESVDITTTSGNTGAIACTANGDARIYNVGILGGSVGGAAYTGGLVGFLDGNARVINCYSYATIKGGNLVGGIVGYNNVATTASTIATITNGTMVMNCMFYGDIEDGQDVAPIYNGNNINNLNSGGLNTFNYYAYDKLKTKAINTYNCALAVEEKYLNRIEFYRLLLNSNKKLAAYYASTTTTTVSPSDMSKWVLETADRQNTNPYPYPILKAQGRYPSIINIDADHAEQLSFDSKGRLSEEDRNKGGKISTLSVTISAPNRWTNAPSSAKLLDENGDEITNTATTRTITLNRTDKDEARFNFNYDKVQLPYYNDYGTKNYTGYKVVTGWKIIDITTIAGDPYTISNYDYTKTYSSNKAYFDYPNYNFANRNSSQKDLYSVSGRVFSQGAYFDVPYGVTSITIEPYWGNAAYVADEYLDVVCKKGSVSNRNAYISDNVTSLGKQFDPQTITIDGSTQTVYTSISNALGTGTPLTGSKVYDNAIVLVGNLHHIGTPSSGDKAFTLMSVDLDKDNEPDYSLIYCDNDRHTVCPIRFDFLNIPGTAQAQKPNGTNVLLNAAIFRTKGWFEITNTALMYFTQYEYENQGAGNTRSITKSNAPLILLGGYIDQFVSAQSFQVEGKTIYIHVGGNVLINSFGLGTHSDGSKVTPHVPVSVTGGDFNSFYLTGTYNQNAEVVDDNAECYISGGRFGELAGACQEQIGSTGSANYGNVQWQIFNADITEFFGGGINDVKPVQGNITTDIFNSHVGTFCGGPKFGNMAANKTVTTTAEGCVINTYYGAGYGGNSYSRKKYFDNTNYNFANQQKYYYNPGSGTKHENERGKYYDGTTTDCPTATYGKKGRGIATDFDYEFFVWTSGAAGARFFIKFVSFSLAQCNNVTSTLTGCIINKNFYGGGQLGKVEGTVTSELNNCEVKGNVFGAGYSATLPEIDVRDSGFSKYPNFNSNAGIFESGVPAIPTSTDLSGTTKYEWKNSSLTNGSIAIEIDDSNPQDIKRYVYTNIDIKKSNLGSVNGNVTLTIKGNSVIGTASDTTGEKGNVFGGGEASYVTGADHTVTVNIQGNTQVFGNVYGGGDKGVVQGSATVNIEN